MKDIRGQCYVISEALYHFLGGKVEGWTPQVVRHEGNTHWYLKHRDGLIVDATAAQFKTPVPYHKGRGCGFLTKKPSRRTRQLMLHTVGLWL